MTAYIRVRRIRGGVYWAELRDGWSYNGFMSGTADAALKRAWALWGSHIPAFIRPEARP